MAEPQGLRARKKQRTLQTISDTAVTLFLERGFEKVSVSEIAERAEVSKPTLFRYFPSKEDMALHRIGDHEDEAARVVRARGAGEPPLGALRRNFLRGLEARDPVTGLCDHEQVLAFLRLLHGTPSLVARMHAYTGRAEDALARALLEAHPADSASDGELADVSARLAAGQIVTVQRVLALDNWQRIDGGASADKVSGHATAAAEHAFGMLSTGLRRWA
ncbi:TetR family transcriptional regulator [Streptomyces daqingensis]|uniref:TetR family transcriptional regulator n=1 Tax=Streptomyces daqingensis TaxID=1472640 RepID=A0ABQ2LUQ3_9ACTN|nr:TetR/AcrR family transcriptional regulator [Streptomyces daqingensis]GGO43414.1 TetR family transcriptional regulator [Streptomyces daqingensis]